MKIAILLATYNSQIYLKEQLDSLLNQSYKKFTVYIRDDGSTDSTIEIVKSYCNRHSNFVLLDDFVLHRRSMGSFLWLLEHVTADYYMFCDHDDVWLPAKVEMSLKKMKDIEQPHRAALVCSDLVVVDSNLKVINNSFWDYMKLRPDLLTKKEYAMHCNIFTGCTMLINEEAKKLVYPVSENAIIHDAWIALRILANEGIVGCIKEPLILYRQHGGNVYGAHEVNIGWRFYITKLFFVKRIIKGYVGYYRVANDAFDNKLSKSRFIFYRMVYFIKKTLIRKELYDFE